jgi:hypothetical protein
MLYLSANSNSNASNSFPFNSWIGYSAFLR